MVTAALLWMLRTAVLLTRGDCRHSRESHPFRGPARIEFIQRGAAPPGWTGAETLRLEERSGDGADHAAVDPQNGADPQEARAAGARRDLHRQRPLRIHRHPRRRRRSTRRPVQCGAGGCAVRCACAAGETARPFSAPARPECRTPRMLACPDSDLQASVSRWSYPPIAPSPRLRPRFKKNSRHVRKVVRSSPGLDRPTVRRHLLLERPPP